MHPSAIRTNQKKICLLGSFCVGKTSLVRRYVQREFSDQYLTTVGVRVDKKELAVNGTELELLVWDIYGQDRFQSIRPAFIRGASGYLLVVDGTRRSTLDEAAKVKSEADQVLGEVPYVVLLNKSDLFDDWEISETDVRSLGDDVLLTSAKTGENVDNAFHHLASRIVTSQP